MNKQDAIYIVIMVVLAIIGYMQASDFSNKIISVAVIISSGITGLAIYHKRK